MAARRLETSKTLEREEELKPCWPPAVPFAKIRDRKIARKE
jgi:hypothetical protein